MKKLFAASIFVCSCIFLLVRLTDGLRSARVRHRPRDLRFRTAPAVSSGAGGISQAYAPNDLVQNEWRDYAKGRSTGNALWLAIKFPTWAVAACRGLAMTVQRSFPPRLASAASRGSLRGTPRRGPASRRVRTGSGADRPQPIVQFEVLFDLALAFVGRYETRAQRAAEISCESRCRAPFSSSCTAAYATRRRRRGPACSSPSPRACARAACRISGCALGAQRSSKKFSHSRGRDDDRVPQKRLEDAIELLLVHLQLEQPAGVFDGRVARLQPNALGGLRSSVGKKLARRHPGFVASPFQRNRPDRFQRARSVCSSARHANSPNSRENSDAC